MNEKFVESMKWTSPHCINVDEMTSERLIGSFSMLCIVELHQQINRQIGRQHMETNYSALLLCIRTEYTINVRE